MRVIYRPNSIDIYPENAREAAYLDGLSTGKIHKSESILFQPKSWSETKITGKDMEQAQHGIFSREATKELLYLSIHIS